MAKEIIGVQHCKGIYQGMNFEGLRLHLLGENRNTTGKTAENIYIKIDRAGNLLNYAKGDTNALIGLKVETSFDEYRKIQRVDIVS